jgi:hypothetical protein
MTKNTKDKLRKLINDLNDAYAKKKSELDNNDAFSDMPNTESEIKLPLHKNDIHLNRELTDRFSLLQNLLNEIDSLFEIVVEHIGSNDIADELIYHTNTKIIVDGIKKRIEAI